MHNTNISHCQKFPGYSRFLLPLSLPSKNVCLYIYLRWFARIFFHLFVARLSISTDAKSSLSEGKELQVDLSFVTVSAVLLPVVRSKFRQKIVESQPEVAAKEPKQQGFVWYRQRGSWRDVTMDSTRISHDSWCRFIGKNMCENIWGWYEKSPSSSNYDSLTTAALDKRMVTLIQAPSLNEYYHHMLPIYQSYIWTGHTGMTHKKLDYMYMNEN